MARDDDDLRALWQAAPVTSEQPKARDLRAKADEHARAVRWRNAAQHVMAAIGIGIFACKAYAETELPLRVAYGVAVLAILAVSYKLRRDGSPVGAAAPDAPLAEHRRKFRTALERQRDLLRGTPRWYLGPLYVTMLFALGAMAYMDAGAEPLDIVLGRFAVKAGVALAVVVANGAVNLFFARRLQRRIDALDE
ncbi:MAG TPA: hypothetical protein VGI39_29020 [Polyangiaceae bacterium]|jgi:hypothetical protein